MVDGGGERHGQQGGDSGQLLRLPGGEEFPIQVSRCPHEEVDTQAVCPHSPGHRLLHREALQSGGERGQSVHDLGVARGGVREDISGQEMGVVTHGTSSFAPLLMWVWS